MIFSKVGKDKYSIHGIEQKSLMRKTTDYRTLVVIKCRKITHVKCGRGDISLTIFITLPTKKLESKNSLRSLSIRFVYRYYWMV